MALINLRNALMAGKRLPYDAEVEFLESTGTQWIDTGVIPDTVDLDINIALTVIAQGHLFGSRTNSNFSPATNHLWSSYGNNAGQFRKDWIGENSYLPLSTTAPNIIGLHSSASGSSVVHDGATWTGGVKTTNSLSLYLFAVNNNGTAATGVTKIYQCKITKNGVLVRDFIPVRVGTVGYLYDRVSGKLFGNAGTGDFVLGPDVVPVEYIESHGTEWIDTGLVWDSLKWECVADITATRNIDENYIISQYGSGQGAVYAFVYMHQNRARLAYNRNAAVEYAVNKQFFGTKHTWHAIYESGAQRLDIGDNIHLSASQQYVAGLTEEGMRIILGGMQTLGGKATGIRFGNVMIAHVSTSVRSFRPVRVGTGSTWEGAMMDTLTRRIYRNAGTGAFTYGNDLKYPIPAE